MVIKEPVHLHRKLYRPIPRGTSYIIPIRVINDKEEPYDISAFQVFFTMKDTPSDDNFDDSHAVIKKQVKEEYCDLANGQIAVHLTSRETWVIPGRYFFDIELVREGSVIRLVSMETEVIGGPTNRTITSDDIETVGGLGEEILLILTKAQPIVCLNPFSGSIGGIDDIPELPREGAYVRKQSDNGNYWAKLTTEENDTQITNTYDCDMTGQPTLGFKFSMKRKLPVLFQNIQDYYLCGKDTESDIEFRYQREGLIGDRNVGLFSFQKLLTYFPGKNTLKWNFALNSTGKEFLPVEKYLMPGIEHELTNETYHFGISSDDTQYPTTGVLKLDVTLKHYSNEEDVEYLAIFTVTLNFLTEYEVDMNFHCDETIGIPFTGFHYIEEVPAGPLTYGRKRSRDGSLSWVQVPETSLEEAPILDHEAFFNRRTKLTISGEIKEWSEVDPFHKPDFDNNGVWVYVNTDTYVGWKKLDKQTILDIINN